MLNLQKKKAMQNCWLLLFATLLLSSTIQASQILYREENGVKTAVYLSPKFVQGAGSVENKYYHNVDFPKGHIALKEFSAEVVDEKGNSVPLHETYLHHWLIVRYYALTTDNGEDESKRIVVRNSGVCQNTLGQYFGLGSETRRTDTYVPDPYGIEVGNPADIPDGYVERWYLNVHAIDTRGVVDRLGCTECKCDLYNLTRDEYDRPLRSDYIGGLLCCYDQTQCRLREGFKSIKRNRYLKYTVKWVDWVDTIVPVKIYILDVTDTREREGVASTSVGLTTQMGCKVEYEVEPCGVSGVSSNGCLNIKKTSIVMPKGGYVIYGAAHQHSGGILSALYGEDGRMICTSRAIYGEGKEAGNEAGYIVGMTTCYPQPGSVKISDGEILVLESNYSSSQMHTGVMGLFYLLIAEQPPHNVLESIEFPKYSWALIFLGLTIAFVAGFSYLRRNERNEGYQSLVV
ncbi:Stress up-regulated nod [Thalictrum thalictroides]|uniref:Stress up-regulated nod n=1 Tax=Thalictrum thalictroides TaxID=46969 RepID=A0A7J6UVW7_THATH|nr:Stress up-regulated nod [Thalictrum thalictroides]